MRTIKLGLVRAGRVFEGRGAFAAGGSASSFAWALRLVQFSRRFKRRKRCLFVRYFDPSSFARAAVFLLAEKKKALPAGHIFNRAPDKKMVGIRLSRQPWGVRHFHRAAKFHPLLGSPLGAESEDLRQN